MRAIRLLLSFPVTVVGFPGFGPEHSHGGPAYSQIKPALPTQSGDRIEIVEIFWYGCSHCFSFEPHIKAWLKSKPEDVVFRQVPGVVEQPLGGACQGVFRGTEMGALEKFHSPLFNALHVNRRNIFPRDSLIDLRRRQALTRMSLPGITIPMKPKSR